MKVFTTVVATATLATSAFAQRGATSPWQLQTNLVVSSPTAISNFFNFEVWSGDNGGIVSYVSQADATAAGIFTSSRSTALRLGVDTATPNQQWRKSVRLLSKNVYNGGLFIFDVKAIPAGCGLWPALWMVGANWPNQGEIDIIEGVHATTRNAMSVHTGPGCYQGTSGFSGSFMLAGANANNCDALATGVQGCGVRDARTNSFGPGFNSVPNGGGGIYAMSWDESGISTWYWPRGQIPRAVLDVTIPMDPSNFGTPANFVSSANCNPSQYFKDLRLVINTAVCGTWPSGVWNDDLSYAGQSGSCAARTGYPTCESYMQANPQFSGTDNSWIINGIKIYQKTG